jgi:branched-subunit amino acid permease
MHAYQEVVGISIGKQTSSAMMGMWTTAMGARLSAPLRLVLHASNIHRRRFRVARTPTGATQLVVMVCGLGLSCRIPSIAMTETCFQVMDARPPVSQNRVGCVPRAMLSPSAPLPAATGGFLGTNFATTATK